VAKLLTVVNVFKLLIHDHSTMLTPSFFSFKGSAMDQFCLECLTVLYYCCVNEHTFKCLVGEVVKVDGSVTMNSLCNHYCGQT
jgi:hypothetical protein